MLAWMLQLSPLAAPWLAAKIAIFEGQSAAKVAAFLAGHPQVAWVNYAGLPGHRDHERATKLFPIGPGAVFGFGVKGGLEAGRKFIDSVGYGLSRAASDHGLAYDDVVAQPPG